MQLIARLDAYKVDVVWETNLVEWAAERKETSIAEIFGQRPT